MRPLLLALVGLVGLVGCQREERGVDLFPPPAGWTHQCFHADGTEVPCDEHFYLRTLTPLCLYAPARCEPEWGRPVVYGDVVCYGPRCP